MAEKLVFIEFEDEARDYLEVCQKNNISVGSHKVIPLSLPVRLILKKNNIPYQDTLLYFDNKSHYRAMKQSEDWLNILESFTGLEEIFLSEVSFCIRPVYSYLLWLIEIIAHTVEDFQPEVLVGPTGLAPGNNRDWKLNPQNRPLGFLIQDFAVKKGIQFQCFKKQEFVDKPLHPQTGAAVSTQSFPVRLGFRILTFLLDQLRKQQATVLITSRGYGLGRAAEQLKDVFPFLALTVEPNSGSFRFLLRNFYRLFSKSDIDLPITAFISKSPGLEKKAARIRKGIDDLIAQIQEKWQEQFVYEGVDLTSYIVYQLRTGIVHHLATLVYLQTGVQTLLKRIKPGIVISPFSAGIYAIIGQVSRELNIPALMITHGSHLPPHGPVEEMEQQRLTRNLMLTPFYQYTAAQSPWAERHAAYFKGQQQVLNTGPVLFARTQPSLGNHLRRKLGVPEKAAIIVYAVAQRKRSSIWFHGYETEDEYLQDMKDLVLAINQMENTFLLLKLHPSSEFSDPDMRAFLPPCERLLVLNREPFDQVLSAASLLVSYGSTTIEEALLNRIPVVQYDRWARYCHIEAFNCDANEPENWETDAIYYVTRPERLVRVLEHALDHADEASANDQLYKKHLFSPGQFQPLSFHIKNILS